MRLMNMNKAISKTQLFLAIVLTALLLAPAAFAAAPGITGPTFNLTARAEYLTQPDGAAVYSWGFGCAGAPTGYAPSAISGAFCMNMQVPGPTLIVTQGDTVKVNLTNNLPTAAGNTSILFPGFNVTSSAGAGTAAGLLTREATPGGTITYSFTATTPGTRSYYSGTQGDLQVEMGLYGAIIVLPSTIPPACTSDLHSKNLAAESFHGESDFRLAAAAYNHAKYLKQRTAMMQWWADYLDAQLLKGRRALVG